MVHCYKNGGYHIVLDVNSGSVHVVDRAVYDMIPVCEKAYEKKCRMHSSGCEKESCKAGDKEGRRCDGDFSAMREAVFSDTALQEKYDRKTLEEALSEIEELVAQELLFSEDIYEEYVDG
ncbi:MAG: thioether cross-link-forming SCIFF peptide maturase, partial [Lachnospiraceae bacterium]|nr:thioether cross-link-forming SCIFF peptide maturase [Lachnospiraceae bacterium]